ncbi:VPS10 domain-containing protein [Falsibacillus albus]|uniref:Sortilin N-terminal domain-containing protein n=1 Tax=Falsibacillus albus TaxID=2478915 RepID=A0A3L7JVL6_9BACI|nr:YCF48-related protein [Falsibacillus albus]RLQ94355.1 hypothetical protein D9X91_14990 [Falsibacillus albus]
MNEFNDRDQALIHEIKQLPQKYKLSKEKQESIMEAIRKEHEARARKKKVKAIAAWTGSSALLVGAAALFLSLVLHEPTVNQPGQLQKNAPQHKIEKPSQVKKESIAELFNKKTSLQAAVISPIDENWVIGTDHVFHLVNGKWQETTPEGFAADDKKVMSEKAAFPSKQQAIIAKVISPTETKIYSTKDDGATWNTSSLNDTITDVDFSFIDGEHGWMLGKGDSGAGSQGYRIYSTKDGGGSWTKVSSQLSSGMKFGITFVNGSIGFMGVASGPDDGTEIDITKDGGKSWDQQTLDYYPNVNPQLQNAIDKPTFLDASHGIMPVRIDQKMVLYETGDQGESWQPMNEPLDAKGNVNNVYILNDKTAWAFTSDEVYHTTDGGKTWKNTALPESESYIKQVFFTSEEEGYLITEKDQKTNVYQTKDAGATWTNLNS